jgi:hypothetical protein
VPLAAASHGRTFRIEAIRVTHPDSHALGSRSMAAPVQPRLLGRLWPGDGLRPARQAGDTRSPRSPSGPGPCRSTLHLDGPSIGELGRATSPEDPPYPPADGLRPGGHAGVGARCVRGRRVLRGAG